MDEDRLGRVSQREILRLAIPNILTNVTIPLLGAVDTAVVGRLAGLDPLGAVALGTTLFSFLYLGFIFLRMGTTGLTAQAFGAGDDAECERVLARALLVAAGSAALLLLLQGPLEELAFRLLAGTPGVEAAAREYFDIRIWAAPATLGLYALGGWFLGMQDARTPLLLAITSNGVNIVLDWWLAWRLGWGVEGIAWGTLVAQYLGLAVALVAFRRRTGRWLPAAGRSEVLDPARLRRFGGLGRDIFVRSMLMQLVLLFFMARSAAEGDLPLAVNAVLMQLWALHAYFVDGFAFAAEAIVGRRIGAGEGAGLRAWIRSLFAWGIGVSLGVSLLFWWLREPILGVFTDKPEVVAGAAVVWVWTLAAPPINAVAFLLDGIFLGATAGRAMRDAMLISTLAGFFGVYWLLEPLSASLGPHRLWLALTAWELTRGLSLASYMEREVHGRLSEGPAGVVASVPVLPSREGAGAIGGRDE